jgi:hypothetical protein
MAGIYRNIALVWSAIGRSRAFRRERLPAPPGCRRHGGAAPEAVRRAFLREFPDWAEDHRADNNGGPGELG